MTPEAEFWEWFVANEAELLDADGYRFVELIGPRISACHDGLAFEVGAETQRPREFVISADGIPEVAGHVEALCDAAPEFEAWRITRFRPPAPDYAEQRVSYGDVELSAESIRVLLLASEKSAVDLALYVDGWTEESVDRGHLEGATYILLDQAIGEYNVMFLVGYIDWHPLSEAHEASFPFDELAARFADAVERVTGGE